MSATHAPGRSPVEKIIDTKARYALAVDFQDWASFGPLFAQDATFDISALHFGVDARTGARVPDPNFSDEFLDDVSAASDSEWPVVGREAIVDIARTGMASIRSSHHFHLPRIDFVSPTAAHAIFPMEDWLWFDEGAPLRSLHGLGHYHETYVEQDDRWVIQTLRLTRVHVTWE